MKLTQQEKTQRMAELAGWKHIKTDYYNHWQNKLHDGWHSTPPSHFTSLDAVHELWCKLTDDQKHDFWGNLASVCDVDSMTKLGRGAWNHEIGNATAAQRAEALGITLGLWKEGE